jgi:PAS domain S-box-containing protein
VLELTKRSPEQKLAEAEVDRFRQQLGPFVVAAETTRMPMVFTDAERPGHRVVFANDSFLSLTGYNRSEVLGQSFETLVTRGTDARVLAQIKEEFAATAIVPKDEDTPDAEIHCCQKDGSDIWAAIFISPVHDVSGKVTLHFVSLVDHTKHRQEQARCELLVAELNHRVKNTLSTVQAIAVQALRTSKDPMVVRESIQSRLFALSRSHDLLTRVEWQHAGLHDLVTTALEPFAQDGRSERVSISGENVLLPPKTILALGIAFHELATNAVKFGAFMNEAGVIAIDWRIEPQCQGNRLVVRWRETGGPPVVPPTRRGFGSQVIERGLPHELHGTVHIDYPPDGVVCTIDIPAPRVRHGK